MSPSTFTDDAAPDSCASEGAPVDTSSPTESAIHESPSEEPTLHDQSSSVSSAPRFVSKRRYPWSLVRSIEAAAFWTAITLPFLYLPLLLTGLSTGDRMVAFLGLVSLNVVALVVGHRYGMRGEGG